MRSAANSCFELYSGPMTTDDFAEQVRSIARAKWSLPHARSEYIGTARIDCAVRTEDVAHLLMAVSGPGLARLKEALDSLLTAHKVCVGAGQATGLWIVT